MPHDLTDPEDAVGYRRPPKHGRFKPGQSGNPKGKRKGSHSMRSTLEREFRRTIDISENGRSRKVTVGEALGKRLTAMALKGDLKAIQMLLAYTVSASDGASEPVRRELNANQLRVLERLALEMSEDPDEKPQ